MESEEEPTKNQELNETGKLRYNPKEPFDVSHFDLRINELEQHSLGQLLLQEREYLFERIHRGKDLLKTMLYCTIYSLILCLAYGMILGMGSGYSQMAVLAVKVPGVLFGTLILCLPVLFSFNIFMGSKLSFQKIFTIMLLASYLASMVLASLGPILLLFTVFSDDSSKGFLHILNILFFIISGGLGIGLLWKAMEYFVVKSYYEINTFILKVWSGIYVFVGMQIAWSLKVFGDLSELPIFKQLGIEGNFYMAIFELIKSYMGGGD